MQKVIFFIAVSIPVLVSGQTSYTNCQSYGNRLNCEHKQQWQPNMGRIQTVNPSAYMPQAPQLSNRNPVLDGMREAQEQELREQQIKYYRNLNRQMQ